MSPLGTRLPSASARRSRRGISCSRRSIATTPSRHGCSPRSHQAGRSTRCHPLRRWIQPHSQRRNPPPSRQRRPLLPGYRRSNPALDLPILLSRVQREPRLRDRAPQQLWWATHPQPARHIRRTPTQLQIPGIVFLRHRCRLPKVPPSAVSPVFFAAPLSWLLSLVFGSFAAFAAAWLARAARSIDSQ